MDSLVSMAAQFKCSCALPVNLLSELISTLQGDEVSMVGPKLNDRYVVEELIGLYSNQIELLCHY
jgi:hypothetical protein